MHQTMKMKIQLGKIWEFSTPIEKGPGSKSEDNETSVTKDTEMQIKHEEEVFFLPLKFPWNFKGSY